LTSIALSKDSQRADYEWGLHEAVHDFSHHIGLERVVQITGDEKSVEGMPLAEYLVHNGYQLVDPKVCDTFELLF